MITSSRILLPLLLLLVVGCSPAEEPAAEAGDGTGAEAAEAVVNVYSSRHYDTDDEIYRTFEEETGIAVNLIEGESAALLERLRREGEDSPADVFLTVDAGRLHQAAEAGIFTPVDSELLEQRIPANLRHPDGLWFGLTRRARVIVYARDRVEPGAISTYEELADPKWRGEVLIRSSSNVYNQSLMGSIVAAHGAEAAEEWCRGLVANLARTPQGGDRDQIRAVAAGEGDLAVVNSYYLAHMLAGDEADREAASKVGIVHPNQDGRGTHVNISGAGVVEGAPHRDNAVRFLEFLTGPEAQQLLAAGNKEYPVAGDHGAVPELAEFGDFRADPLDAAVFGAEGQQALMIMDRCGWR